ncbi:hypothetical protein SLE2022_244850 [Rubroshorea leprosula]
MASDIQETPDEPVTKSAQQVQEMKPTLKRHDSMDLESSQLPGGSHGSKDLSWSIILHLAFQSLGVVYGDIATSPLYTISSIFYHGSIANDDDIIGVLSLIWYTLTLIPLVKYICIVLYANDNGDGGTFALYSLICRYAKVGLLPSQQAEDVDVSNYRLKLPKESRQRRASALKSKLENSNVAKYSLLFAALLGTSMLIGDGVLTPCISVLSAVGGIKEATPKLTEDMIAWFSAVILVILFAVQKFGTDKIGYTFAPILCIWCLLIGGIGLFNFIKYDPTVAKAIYPKYIVDYFRRNPKEAWISLGGVVLCITGVEALFADVGHFSVKSIQISTCFVVYPSIMLAYTGQSSFLRKHPEFVTDAFYKSVPGPLYWPMFVVAVLASIIGSQSLISGTFSIIQQSLSLGCFPHVKVVRTSSKYEGQVYIPEVNYFLMLACLGVTLGFRTTDKIGNAYGLAVVFVIGLTSCFTVLVMILIWKSNIFVIIAFVVVIGSMELLFLSSVLYKFQQGGYLPLAFAAIMMTIMLVWNTVYRRKYYYELEHKISSQMLIEMTANTHIPRFPGLALFYSEVVQGIPPILKQYLDNVPALHSVLVLVSIKSLPISKVPDEERFLFRRVEPRELNMFRCVVRYGYKDLRKGAEPFEGMLIEKLKEFMREDFLLSQKPAKNKNIEEDGDVSHIDNEEDQQEMLGSEIQELEQAAKAGVFHLISENEVIASKGSNLGKRILIDYAYNFLKKNSRKTQKVFHIPQQRLLKVGMIYEL